MSKTTVLRRRLDAITISFSGTIAAKMIKLSDDQRRTYGQWSSRMATFCASYPDGEAFARLLSGEQLPPLRSDVRDVLFGPIIAIPADATDAEAAEIYRRMLDD